MAAFFCDGCHHKKKPMPKISSEVAIVWNEGTTTTNDLKKTYFLGSQFL